MTLSHATLNRLLAKEAWSETRWLPGGRLISLEKNEGSETLLKVWNREQILELRAPASLGASLEPRGHSYCATQQQLFALTRNPEQIAAWHLGPQLEAARSRTLSSPATLLTSGPRWLSWVQAQRAYQWWTQDFAAERPAQLFAELPGLPYGLAWHPLRPLCLMHLCPPDRTPWQSATLVLAHYSDVGNAPKLTHQQTLNPPDYGDSPCQEAHFSADGTEILGLWRSGEWNQLWSYHLESARWKQLSFTARERGKARRRSDEQSFVSRGSDIIAVSQERGYFQLERLDRKQNEWAPLLPREYTFLDQVALSPEGDRLSVISSAAHIPPSQLELQARDGGWHLEGQRGPKTGVEAFAVQGEALSWPSTGGGTVHGFLYRDRRRSGPLPLLLPIHGGPTEQVAATWPIKAQAFVDSGYAVLYINYRGSWGYGASYQKALAGRWGELDVQDIVSSIGPLAAAGWIDPQRVGIWGGGLGGSLVLRALQLHPQTFRAAIAAFPICDFADYWNRAGLLQRAELDEALGSHGSPARRAQLSPQLHVHSIRTPLALFQGARDPLVPSAHIESLAAALESHKVPSWLSVYPDEGHSWQARSTLEDYYCKIGSFLARFMRR